MNGNLNIVLNVFNYCVIFFYGDSGELFWFYDI